MEPRGAAPRSRIKSMNSSSVPAHIVAKPTAVVPWRTTAIWKRRRYIGRREPFVRDFAELSERAVWHRTRQQLKGTPDAL